MLIPNIPDNRAKLIIAVSFAGWLTFSACTVSVKDHENGDNSKVDIETPIGGIHVDEQADLRDIGLPLYPGARHKSKTGQDSKSANVNISSGLFGVKVVAIEYESDDPPDKLLAYYRDKMKKFGSIVECRTDKQGGDLKVKASNHEDGSRPVSCDDNNSGNVVELKTGTDNNQHLVSVEPEGKGTDFSLVYVRTRGKQGEI
jgi:hypothetical protein